MMRAPAVYVGFAIAVVLHLALGGWWLDTGLRVGAVSATLALAALVLVVAVKQAIAARDLWLGFMAGTTLVLFVVGPGTIFPLVLAAAGVISGLAVLVGFGIGVAAKTAFR